MKLIKEERFTKIMEYLKQRHYASNREIMDYLGVSKATVRRDLIELQQQGRIAAARGGVSLILEDTTAVPSYKGKKNSHTAEKKRIAQAAASLVSAGETIFISAGTTTRAMLPFLSSVPSLHLVTNDLLVAADSTFIPNIDVTVTGGKLRKNYYTLRGYAAEDYVRKIRTDMAFIGMDAIDPAVGCYMDNDDEVPLIERVIGSTLKTIIVCDSSKLSNQAFMLAAPFSVVHTLITDDGILPEAREMIESRIPRLIVV